MNKKTVALALAMGLASSAVVAQEVRQENFYAGGGLGLNSVSGFDDAMGYQFFAGYELDMVDLGDIELAVELGFMDTGDFEQTFTDFMGNTSTWEMSASGAWANAVFGYPFSPRGTVLGRVGLDFGDDDGPMFGVGAGYQVMPQVELRGEYVLRDNIDSLQANILYRF